MIDIHITDKGLESHIENVKAVELLEVFAKASIAILPDCHIPLDMFADVLLNYVKSENSENEED